MYVWVWEYNTVFNCTTIWASYAYHNSFYKQLNFFYLAQLIFSSILGTVGWFSQSLSLMKKYQFVVEKILYLK